MSERAILMELVEAAEPVAPDWPDALRRVGYLGRHFPRRREVLRPRRVLVLVAVFLAVAYAVTAVAADRPPGRVVYWLFDRSGETYPVRQVPELGPWIDRERSLISPEVRAVPVIQGTVARHRFELAAFMKDGESTVGFSAGGPAEPYYGTKVPSFDGMGSGFPVHHLRPEGSGELHWVSLVVGIPQGFEASGGGTGPKWLFGVASPYVSQVDLENENDGTIVRVPTFAAPSSFQPRARLWIAVLRLDQLVHTVVPRDKDGRALEHWHQEFAR